MRIQDIFNILNYTHVNNVTILMTPIAISDSKCKKHEVKCMVAIFTLVKRTILEAQTSKTHGKTKNFRNIHVCVYIYIHTHIYI